VKKLSCPSRRFPDLCGGRPQGASVEAGYVLLIVMMLATLLLISLAAAVPSIYVEGQREKETELIFRGEQYASAIMMFHQKFKRYPTSVKELLHTNNMSFLRQPFRDPMTKSGKWRYIHATASGVILDSKILGPPGKRKTDVFGNKTPESGTQQANQPTAATAGNGSQQSGFSTGQFSLPGVGQNSSANQQQSGGSSFFGGNKLVGAYIVGVASTSHHRSIGVFDKRTEYDEWEFLGVPGAPGAPNIEGPGAVPGVGAQPGQAAPGGKGSNSGGFHLSPSQPSQPSQPGSIFGGSSNP
jgi:type II secretory pathway pseudopilin PulG